MEDLKGKLFVDIWNDHTELYKEGIGVGVGGPDNTYQANDGNPFQIADNINNEASSHNSQVRYVTNLHNNSYIQFLNLN